MPHNASFINQSASPTPVWQIYSREVRIWYTVMVTLSIIAILVSLLLILTIASSKPLRSRSGILLINLLIQVVCQSGIGMPLVMLSYHGVPVESSDKDLCTRSIIIYHALTISIDWTEVTISSNRFVAICFPHVYPKWTRKRILLSMAIVPWIIGFTASALPQFGVTGRMQRYSAWDSCAVLYKNSAIANGYTIIGIGVPLGLSLVLYSAIFATLLSRRYSRQKAIQPASASSTRRYRSVRMFFAAFCCYATCLVPAPVAAGHFLKAYSARPILQLIFRAVVLVGMAAIPVIYFALSAQYRLRLTELIKRCRSCCSRLADKPNRTNVSAGATTSKSNEARAIPHNSGQRAAGGTAEKSNLRTAQLPGQIFAY